MSNKKKSANYRAPTIKVTELKINTSKIELVKAIGVGNATITAQTTEGNKTTLCEVVITKKVASNLIKLDDISKEASEFALNDFEKIRSEYVYIDEYINGKPNDKYWEATENGGYRINELGREEIKKQEEKLNRALNNRVEIINRLIDNRKSFIILYHTKECEEREYSVVEGAEKILKDNNYSYLNTADSPSGDDTLEKSKIDINKLNGGSIIIIKKGEVYVSINPDVDAIKNDEETKNWLSKYIDI